MYKNVLILIVLSIIGSSFSCGRKNAITRKTTQDVRQIDSLRIENEDLSVEIALKGAEVISIYNKKEKFEHLWQGEPGIWKQHAPILFPIVGKLVDKSYTIDGKTYKMGIHGFVAYSTFTLERKTATVAVYSLQSNAKTSAIYPYRFKLSIKYELLGSKLIITNTVENIDSKEIYFSIGAHPGFNIPINNNEKYSDYYLEFEKNETLARLELSKVRGFRSGNRIERFIDSTNKLPLSHKLFDDRAVILEGVVSESVTLKSDHSKLGVKVGIKDFSFLGVWSSKKPAAFVCIEPWYGVTDAENTTGDLKKRKGIEKLAPGKTFKMNYFIEIIATR